MRFGALQRIVAASVVALAFLAENSAAELGVTATPLPNNVFVVSCRFSHRNADDLIRFPNRPGMSHNHTYVGNRSTNARSTPSTLRAAPTTCDRPADTSAYWMPTLYAKAKPVNPEVAAAYYRRATADPVVAFPPGFRMIAGNAMAMIHQHTQGMKETARQDLKVVNWHCRGGGVEPTRISATAPRCTPSRRLVLRVNFPSCWDGLSLDASDHKSHVAYPVGGRCPKKHPVALPALTLEYQFPAIPVGVAVELASGGQGSGHADFVNSWNQGVLEQLVAQCLNEACGSGRLPLPE